MKQELKKLTMELRKQRSPMASVMVFHLSEIENIGKNAGNRETTEDEAFQYVKKTVEKLKSSPVPDEQEIALLSTFLPKMASEEEVRAFLDTLPEGSNKGQIMGAVKKQFGVNVDMKKVAGML